MFSSNRHDGVHVASLSVEVHRNDAHRSRSYLSLDSGTVDGESLIVGIAKDHPSSCLGNGFRSRNPGMSGGNDFVSGFNSQAFHRDIEGIRSVGARDAMFNSQG